MNTPNLERFINEGRYPSPAYLEGYYDLPEFSVSRDEPLHVLRGKISHEVYMGYLGTAMSLKNAQGRKTKRNETKPVTAAVVETKRNETLICPCGCGQPVGTSPTGRKRKYATSSCRLRYWRKNNS